MEPLLRNGKKDSGIPWKPVVTAVAVVVAREVGVRLFHLAVNKAHSEWIKAKVKERLNVVKQEFGKTETESDIQNGVNPEEARRQEEQNRERSEAARSRDRDNRGRFKKNGDDDTPQKGGGKS